MTFEEVIAKTFYKKPWNEGPEARFGTKAWRDYARYGAEMLADNGSCSKTTNLVVLTLNKRRTKKAQKAIQAGKTPIGRIQRAVYRYVMDEEQDAMMD